MKTTAVSIIGKITFAGAFALLSVSQAVAEERADVLERIAPIGKVTLEGQAAPAAAEEAAPAPVATEEPAPVTEAAAEAESVVEEATEAVADAAAPAEAGGDALALATTSGCMGCHQVETKVVGPAYKEVSAKYKDDAGALDTLAAKVKGGGVGTWGQIPMPPNAHVSDENIRTIVEWVLTL